MATVSPPSSPNDPPDRFTDEIRALVEASSPWSRSSKATAASETPVSPHGVSHTTTGVLRSPPWTAVSGCRCELPTARPS
jgi:hypothetical protein